MPIIQRIEVRCDLMDFWLFYFMENEVEIWRDVVGYEGLYQVSTYGRVMSLVRRNISVTLIRKFGVDADGYMNLDLYKEGKRKNVTVHSIVAKAFIDENYREKSLVVNHKDFNRKNNLLSNLEVVTNRENTNKKHLPSTSKYTGVCWDKKKNKWLSQIFINGNLLPLGSFSTEIEASCFYESALICVKEDRVCDIVKKEKPKTKGYSFYKRTNKWRVHTIKNRKYIHFGYFNTEEEAKEMSIKCI